MFECVFHSKDCVVSIESDTQLAVLVSFSRWLKREKEKESKSIYYALCVFACACEVRKVCATLA